MRNINRRYNTLKHRAVWSVNSHRSARLNRRSRNLCRIKNHKQPSTEPLRQLWHLLKQSLVVADGVNDSQHGSGLTVLFTCTAFCQRVVQDGGEHELADFMGRILSAAMA